MLRDDGGPALINDASIQLREVVESAAGAARRVLVIPAVLSNTGLTQSLKVRLSGLPIVIATDPIAPDVALERWLRAMIDS